MDFYGYPQLTKHESAIKIESKLTNINGSSFSIKSNRSLDTFYASGEENTQGFSGSGVFTHFQGSVTLVGIVQEYSLLDTLHCKYIFPLVEELLKKDGFDISSLEKRKSKIKTNDIDSPYPPFLLPKEQALKRLEKDLFPDIAKGNCILFLGPGALINDDKNFLQNQLIKSYCNAKDLDFDDFEDDSIFDFVDTIKEQDFFKTSDFNNFIYTIVRAKKMSKT